MKISNQEIIYRRNIYFNERSFPVRKFQLPPTLTAVDTGTDLIGADFDDEGSRWTVLRTGEYEGTPVLYYKHKENGTEECSSVAEVRTWVKQTKLHQATNKLTPTRKGYIDTLAEESFKAITNYNLKLPPNSTKPTSIKKAGNQSLPQWFRAEAKDRDGFLDFETWERLPQADMQDIRKRALRCHHLYDIKLDQTAKKRVVVNTDTTSPVASQLQLRLFLSVSAFRKYPMIQLDLTNAYLHAPILDVVYIIIPEGFPGQGEIARLRKAAYGTKQGARRFYDYTASVFKHIGLSQCTLEPCLFRYLVDDSECFLLQYVDDSLIAGQLQATEKLQQEMKRYFKCKFIPPKDFLGLDITIPQPGDITLSMHTFTAKMVDALQVHDDYPGDIITPCRTDKKVIRGENVEPNENLQKQSGKLDLAYHGHSI